MKEKVNMFLADSATALGGGVTGHTVAPGDNSGLMILVGTVLAPILKDVLLKLIDKLFTKKSNKNASA